MKEEGTGKILVVDDNRVNRRILEVKLGESGYEVTCAEGGQDALDALDFDGENAGEFDLVVLDIMMPEVDGMEVLKRIRQTKSSIQLPVIMATAKDESSDVVEALEKGANDYVTKPIDLPILLSRIKTQLDLRNAHDDLRSSHRSLVRAAKMESVALLAAGVAHEIRNPLAQITMGLEAIRSSVSSGDQETSNELLDMMDGSVGHADSIVQGLISTASGQRIHVVPGDLNRFVEETIDLLTEEELGGGDVTFELNLDQEVPEALFDPDELRQAVINLLFNAAQAMPEGGIVKVRTGAEPAADIPADQGARSGDRLRNGDKTVVIEIADEGAGVSEDVMTRMFDPFYTSRATGQGTGLGLTVVRKILDLHGGAIRMRNREDRSGLSAKLLLRINRLGVI